MPTRETPPPAPSGDGTPSAEFRADEVNLGHVFALRPRVNTSFPQARFLAARRELVDERYGSIDEAARAVAEKALASAQQKPSKHSIAT